jgi:aspartyl-tRNA synthetase
MERIFIENTPKFEGKNVKVCGWVHTRRDHGKLIFIDLRDRSGILQVVFSPQLGKAYERAGDLRSEWVISVEGKINSRPKGMQNSNLKTGLIEMAAEKLEILNPSETPPFLPDTDGHEINEEIRLKYRYIDLRRPRLAKNIRMRHKLIKHIRDYFDAEGFYEIETPILTKSTPEGARDYVVPSRLHPGEFYALPQAPQQYKQLLMASGVEKYFQIAKCFRDEDTRGDRQPEFTQMDLEMSFVEREDVMAINEAALIDLIKKVYPHKKIQEIPFPRLSYKEAVGKYGTDRPDLRKDKKDLDLLAFCWIIDFPFFKEDDKGKWTFTHNPFSKPKDEHVEWLLKKENIGEILTTQYDVVLNGFELGGGSIRNHQPEALLKVFEIMGYGKEEIKQKFGHMLEAFSYGTPPHGGIAWGLDRLIAILENEPNIREVIAFPKTGDGRDLMISAPSEISPAQLKELGLSLGKKKK